MKPTSAQLAAREKVAIAKAWWDDFNTKNAGKIFITEEQLHHVMQARDRFLRFTEPGVKTTIGERLDACDKQVWIRGEWHDPDTGVIVPVQCLLDTVPRLDSDLALFDPFFAKEVGDVKTTCNASPQAWGRWALQAGYDVQMAWNADMLQAAEPNRVVDNARFYLSESHAPWQPAQRQMCSEGKHGEKALDIGRRKYEQMLSEYCKCIKSGKWPGYDSTAASSDGCTEVHANPFNERHGFEFPAEQEQPEPENELAEIAP